MRKFAWAGALILVMSLAAVAADDVPSFEVYGGVSWLHIDTMKIPGVKTNYMGWDSEAQYNLNKFIGITADIGGNYGRLAPNTPTVHDYNFAFGPTFSFRTEHSVIYAHTLFGANTDNILTRTGSNTSSDTAFAMLWGGGLDLKIKSTFSLRLGELDWLYTRHDLSGITVDGVNLTNHQNNLRYTGGIVINFGGR